VRDKLTTAGVIASGTSPAEFSKHMQAEFVRWGTVRETAKIPRN
jgi:hypothetical protein